MSTPNPIAADEQWLAILAGRESPKDVSDASQRQALQVRRFFQQRDAHEYSHLPSPEGRARLLVKLRQPGALAAIAATHAIKPLPVRRSVAQTIFSAPLALLDWLLPPSGNNTGRYAMVAGVVMAVLVVPMLVQQRGGPDYEPGMKGIPKEFPKSTPAQLVLAENPALTASQIQQALATAGVDSAVQASDTDAVVTAIVPPASSASVRQQLGPWGLAVPANGQLRIRIARSQ